MNPPLEGPVEKPAKGGGGVCTVWDVGRLGWRDLLGATGGIGKSLSDIWSGQRCMMKC